MLIIIIKMRQRLAPSLKPVDSLLMPEKSQIGAYIIKTNSKIS